MNLRFKEGQMVKMKGHDDMIVEGAIGIITDVQTETVKVLWGGMSAFKVDYKYRYGLKEITTTEVDPKNIEVADKLSSWPTEPLRRYYIDDCVKYIGKDTGNLQYGDLLCIYAMNYSKHELQCVKLSDHNIYTISTSDCVLHSICYPLRKGTRVVTSMVSEYTKRGKTGFILKTDYRTYLPYCVKWDDDSTSWVIGITDEDVRHIINILNRNDMWNDKLNAMIADSMKKHDTTRTNVYRAIKTAFTNYAAAKNAKPLDEAAEISIIKKMRDERWANAETYQTAGRMDLSAAEADEAGILEELLPKEPTKEELNAALLKLALDKGWYDDNEEHDIHPVQIPKNQMGIAVKELKAKYPAADGKKIADLVKANLCN